MSTSNHHHSAKECKSCHLSITDGQAYKLGTDQWHVNCFKCSKCTKSLGVDSNFLVLGTGALVCSECSYTCKSCEKKIYDLAILTGDLAYCADCFKCKSCNKPIDDLKYARTSKGLFCMPCHNMLMEKKKKYEKLKKLKAAREKSLNKQLAQRDAKPASSNTSREPDSLKPNDFVDMKIGLMSSSVSLGTDSPNTSNTTTSNTTTPKATAETSVISNKKQRDFESPKTGDPRSNSAAVGAKEGKERSASYESSATSTSEFDLDDYALESSKDNSKTSVYSNDDSPPGNAANTRGATALGTNTIIDRLQTSPTLGKVNGTPTMTDSEDERVFSTPVAIDIKSMKNGNDHVDNTNGFSYIHTGNTDSDMVIPLRSPRRSNLSPVRNTVQYRTPELETPKKKSLAPEILSPTGINRKAHILDNDDLEKEPESFINLDETEEESLMSRDSYKDDVKLLSPIKYNYSPFVGSNPVNTPSNVGLNISGLDSKTYTGNLNYHDENMGKTDSDPLSNMDPNRTPVQADRDTFDENATPNQLRKKQIGGLGRSLSKVLRRGRKQSMGEHTGTPDTPETIVSRKSSVIHSTNTPMSHNRTQSDHSFNAFPTPPVPNTSRHNRSVSETSKFESVSHHEDAVSYSNKELNIIKSEINSLTLTKATILKDIQTLTAQKKLLELDISDKQTLLKELDNTVLLRQQQQKAPSTDDFSMSNRSTVSTKNSFKDDYDSRKMSSTDNILYEEPPHIQYGQRAPTPPLPTSTSTHSNLSSQYNQTTGPTSSNKEKRPNFMKKLFGGNSNPTSASSNNFNKPLSSGKSTISQPMNVKINEDPNFYANEKISNDISNASSSAMKTSISSNFTQWRNGSNQNAKNNNNTPAGNENTIYNMTLEEISKREGGNGVPFVIQTCIAEVENRGLKTEGIYRISASTSTVEKLEVLFETLDINNINELNKMNSMISSGDIHALAGLLKRYLKKIPDSIIPQNVYDLYVGIYKIETDQARIEQLSTLVNNLPRSNKLTLLTLTKHLNLISENEKWNKMTSSSLATVFAPTLVRHDSLHPSQEIQDTKAKTVVTELLFRNYDLIFK